MDIRDITVKKAKGEKLSKEEITYFVKGITDGKIKDYQITSLITAIYIKGMDKEETVNLTYAMANSGEVLDFTKDLKTCDKHSSGGVGDKVTLCLIPLMAACGLKAYKMSGRGLGITGGTIDKLESINGFDVNIPPEKFKEEVEKIGCSVIAQSGNMCIADKIMYALRDATGMIDSIPLIASSIMSKKIASGAKNIILDVKCGSGAFMKSKEEAIKLGRLMKEIGESLNRNIEVFITDMDEPLGYAVGNATEVLEAVSFLEGKDIPDLKEIVYTACTHFLMMTGKGEKEAKEIVDYTVKSKKALLKFKEMIEFQGGDSSFIDCKSKLNLQRANKIYAEKSGYITKLNPKIIGKVLNDLGAGRKKKEDKILYDIGIILNKKVNDYVEENEELLTLYFNNFNDEIKREILNAYEYSENKKEDIKVIKEIIA